ncbi:MAG: hypothetical protein NVS9B14_04880 [Candidatus Acidiferrum sp.]
MAGTDGVRYCPQCKLSVYNFSEMSETEIQALVAARTGHLCARFYQRPDGTVLTQNCPVGFRGVLLRATRLASATLATALTLTHVRSISAQAPSNPSLIQIHSAEKTLTIEVVDAVGAAIPRAEISLEDDVPHMRKWTTNGEGVAQIAGLSSGAHTFKVEAAGFAPRKLRIDGGIPDALTVRLEIGVLVMGGPVEVPNHFELEPSPTPNSLTLPAQSDIPSIAKPGDNRSALQRFFSRLRRIF